MSHAHDHPHAHAPHGDAHAYDRAFAIGIGLNLAFVGVEAYYGWRAGSLALLADAGHNLSDVAGLVLAWAGAWAARLRPDERHTYGWQRAGLMAAFVNAAVLLVAMGSLAWEAVQRLSAPVAVPGWTVMAVAAVGIVVNTATALLFLHGRERDVNVRGAFLHMAGDALVSAGVVGAGALALGFGWAWIDPVASLLIAGVIVVGTWQLLRQSLHLLFDGVPDRVPLAEVHDLLQSLPGVRQVHDLHVWPMGTTRIALTAHLVMPHGGADDAFLAAAATRLHDRFGIDHVTLQAVREPFMRGCTEVPATPARGGRPGHAPQGRTRPRRQNS